MSIFVKEYLIINTRVFTFLVICDKLAFVILKGYMNMKKKGNLFVYIILVAAVLLTKVLGLARNILLSANYGTGIEASAFTAVSNLPLIVFDVTFGTAISAAFVPVFNEKLSMEGNKSANRFASNFLNIVLLFSAVIAVLGIAFPKAAVMLVASGFDTNQNAVNLASDLMRIIMPIICFACGTFIFVGILQSYGQFIAPALVSLFSNLSMILYLVFINGVFGIHGLAVAFCIGWFLQFLFLIPFLKKKKFNYSFVIDFSSPEIKKVAILTLPLFVSALAQPINQLISSNLSSGVSESGVATVNYAYNAYFIVAGVFSYALTNMFFPEMSRRFACKDTKGATLICKDMLSTITAIIMPIMVFLFACSVPVIRIIYERGEFTSQDTLNVAALLTVYSIGMVFLSWQDILNKYFYSMQKSIVPMIAAALGIALNFVLSILLIPVMGLKGLAVSTVVSGVLMTVVLCLFSMKYTKNIFDRGFIVELVKLIAGGIVVYFVCTFLLGLFDFSVSVVMQIIYIAVIFITAVILYFVVLVILRSKNISNIKSFLRKEDRNADI